ncbi:MAG: hypothetical protein QOC81_5029 [Thermoanaerobaculia bacterium]|jgi:hypothetical protein|nr:hypothetical protein [Thermoanaerobaculia bacterium]
MRGKSMHRTLSAALFCVAFVSSAAFASTATSVRLILDERSLLPGTPTGLSVIVSNPGEEELQLPPVLWLVAMNDAGKTFTVRSFTMSTETAGGQLLPEHLRTVASHASRELRFDPAIGIVGSPWFMDQRLWTPGRYRLRAVLAPDVKPNGSFDGTSALVSDENILTVVLSSPEDAAVWEWMRDQKWDEQSWVNRPWQLAKFVNQSHPKSQYMLFAAIFLPRDGEGPSPVVIELVKRFPNKSFTEQVKLLIVQYYEQAESTARQQSNLYVAANASDEARTIASELVRNSRSSNVRAFAKELLDRIPTREQLLKKPETR